MGIDIEPYRPERIEAVRAFNQRLKAGGCPFRFPEQSESSWLPRADGETTYEEFFLATEGREVRGGYVLKRQPFWLEGTIASIGCLYLPLSEGAVNPEYGRVGLQLLLNALEKQPLLYSLGMGGFDNPYPQMLKAVGWQMHALPFHFLVLNASTFCQNIRFLRQRAAMRIGLNLLAATGLGNVIIPTLQALGRRRVANQPVKTERVHEFSMWAESVWRAARANCALVAVRDCAALQCLYPATGEKYLKLRVSHGEVTAGWVVALDSAMKGHKQFGDMRVGSIIDCLSVPGRENEVIHAASEFLRQRGVDLIVSNQSHRHWSAALDRAGFLRGPSNFVFAASPQLTAKITPWKDKQSLIHFTRADGEGPTHL